MQVIDHIFRTYDIRGYADSELSDELVYHIGRAYGTFIKRMGGKKISIGGDVRLSTPRIKKKVIEGILSTGIDVTDIGIVTSPMLYYSSFFFNNDGGAMITGSHNPIEFNGIKMTKGTKPLYGDDIQVLKKMIIDEDYETGEGKLTTYDIFPDYYAEVTGKFRLRKKVRVIIDPGNGTAGPVAVKILRGIGAEVDCINCERDGNFPAHLPDPTVEKYMKELEQKVVEGKYDVGIGFDGDADRIGCIDNNGKIVYGDRLLALFAGDMLSRHPGEKVIFDVKCSKALEEYIKLKGGVPVLWKTGHSLLKAKMKEENALLAGEMSGHMFMGEDYYGIDDAIFAACRVLDIIARDDRDFATILSEIPYYPSSPELRIECGEEEKWKIVEDAKKHFKEKGLKVVDIDGARVTFEKGWGLIRASNTQPIVVLRFEADTEEGLKKIEDEFYSFLKQYPSVKLNEN